MLTLKTEKRDKKSSPESIRKAGQIPAVFYGKKAASTSITIEKKDFMKIFEEAGESTVITLETGEDRKECLIHDVDIDPITGEPRHADFYVFEKGHKVSVALEIEFVGTSSAVKDLGGSLVKVLHEIQVEAMPKDLPHNIEVDISALKTFDDQILAKDIPLPSGVALDISPEEVVALVSAPREEKEEESLPVDLESIEVEKKGKEETPTESEDTEAQSE